MYYSNNLVTNESKNYLQIKRENIPTVFKVDVNKIYLRNSRARPFTINFPLDLNEDLAKISAMILDGSISKDLISCMFSYLGSLRMKFNMTIGFIVVLRLKLEKK